MKTTLAAALLLALAFTRPAFADENSFSFNRGSIHHNDINDSFNTYSENEISFNPNQSQDQDQRQRQRQSQDQRQQQGQSQSGVNVQGQSVNNGQTIAPSQSVTVTAPRQAVSPAGVSAAGTTANCRIAGGASVGAVWGGFSFSGSVVDENCVALEIAKAAIWAGSATDDKDMMEMGKHIIREQARALVKPERMEARNPDETYNQ